MQITPQITTPVQIPLQTTVSKTVKKPITPYTPFGYTSNPTVVNGGARPVPNPAKYAYVYNPDLYATLFKNAAEAHAFPESVGNPIARGLAPRAPESENLSPKSRRLLQIQRQKGYIPLNNEAIA
jgi:hypothetical protein